MQSNVYYHPEKSDLEVVAEIDYSSGVYEYDTRVVWSHPERGLLTDKDAGCSCPIPFDDSTLDSLEPVDYDSLSFEVLEALDTDYRYISEFEAQNFLRKVRKAMKRH